MRKVKILFFAADPFSAPPDGHAARLLLDEDIRQIRAKVRASEHRDVLEFDYRLAARPDDLLQALNEVQPDVVHFSGHGRSDGLVLMDPEGRRPHGVGSEALRQLFQACRGNIQVVVLNACSSLPQAEAIAGAVGCAIGLRGEISDAAAITFGASFYRAIGFGESVRAAYDQARAALALVHFEERECPQLVFRPDVDPARLILVPSGIVEEDAREAGSAVRAKEAGARGAVPLTGPLHSAESGRARGRAGIMVAVIALAGAAAVASENWRESPHTLAEGLPASGTLTLSSSSCTIAAGASRCNVSISWSTTNALVTSAVTSSWPAANTQVGPGNSGGPLPVEVPYNRRTFYLYNDGQELAKRIATSSCASGTTWDGSLCR